MNNLKNREIQERMVLFLVKISCVCFSMKKPSDPRELKCQMTVSHVGAGNQTQCVLLPAKPLLEPLRDGLKLFGETTGYGGVSSRKDRDS